MRCCEQGCDEAAKKGPILNIVGDEKEPIWNSVPALQQPFRIVSLINSFNTIEEFLHYVFDVYT